MNRMQEWLQQNWNRGPNPAQQPQFAQGMGPQQSQPQQNGGYMRVSPGVYQDASGRVVRPQGGRMPPPQQSQGMPQGPMQQPQGMPRLPMGPPQMVAPNQFGQVGGQWVGPNGQPVGGIDPGFTMGNRFVPDQGYQAQPMRRPSPVDMQQRRMAQPTGPNQPVGLLSKPPRI